MKVKALIELLQEYDQEMPIGIQGGLYCGRYLQSAKCLNIDVVETFDDVNGEHYLLMG